MRAVALVAVMVAGCSFATMRSPRGSPPECTESTAAPLADVALAVAAPFVVYALAKSSEQPQPGAFGGDDLGPVLLGFMLGVPLAGVEATSAVYGFVKADRCSRAKRDYQQLMAAPPGPGPYAPPPIAPNGAPPPMYPAPYPPPPPAR